MEYELPDEGEDVLFDYSTNPSLKHDEDAAVLRRHASPADRRRLQKGELIPDEEEELQLS